MAIAQREINAITKDAHALTDRTIEEALRLLVKLQAEVVAEIKAGIGSDFRLIHLRQLQAAITSRIVDFENAAAGLVSEGIGKSFDFGIKAADAPMVALNLSSSVNVSREIVTVLTSFTADRIKGITNEVRDRINAVIQRAVIGNLSAYDAIRDIGATLNDNGPFKEVAYRAERILRTEMLRVFSMATQQRMIANATVIQSAGYSLRKRWLATLDKRTRATHILANGQTVNVDEPFSVGNESAMYPRDPDLSAEESIQCRCVSQSVVTRMAA